MTSGTIYLVTNLQSGNVYIGLTTVGLIERKKRHYTKAVHAHKYGKNETHFSKALLKYDKSVWQWSVLEDNITDTDLLKQREIYWIAFFKSIGAKLYNHTIGGDGLLGYTKTPEHKAKLSAANKDYVFTEEQKRKIAKSKKGNTAAVKTYTLVSPDGVLTTFTNMSEFCRKHNLKQGNLINVAKGKKKSAYGWTLAST